MDDAEQRRLLEDLLFGLQTAFAAADVAVKAQIAGQIRATVKDLAALKGEEQEASKADELRARREARRDDAGDPASSARRGQPRRSGGGGRAR